MEFLIPLVSDFDRLTLVGSALSSISFVSGVFHDLLEVLRIGGVQNVEEVLSIWIFITGVMVLEVNVELRVGLHIVPKVLD